MALLVTIAIDLSAFYIIKSVRLPENTVYHIKLYSTTVPKFNFSTKYVGSLGIIDDHTPRLPPSFQAWVTSQRNVALSRKLRGSLMGLDHFLTCYPLVFVQPGTGRRPVDWCMN